jgi:NAD(P)-dependent dehydrogenase (short-subunit alcohol dehydrogenase family)
MEERIGSEAKGWLGLAGRVCVVTGGGGGIGAETVRELARAGALVAALDRDEDLANSVAREIERSGGRAIGMLADVANAESVAAAARRVQQELGPCRVLVNNAAIRHRNPLIEIDLETWNRVLGVNLTGALLCTQAFGAQMIAAGQGGSLIHVASLVGHYPQSGSGAYCASKAGVIMVSRSLTVELAEHGIRSNVVSPGMTRTPANEGAYRDPEIATARARMTPSGRVGVPADMANTIAFLASDRSNYINGQEIVVDGGMESTLMNNVPRVARTAAGLG